MNKVARLMFIVYAAVFFSSNVFAGVDVFFFIRNNTRWSMNVSATGNNFCINGVYPVNKIINPHGHCAFQVNYKRDWFYSRCSLYHSHQDYLVTFTLANNKKYSTTLTWYKPWNSEPILQIPPIPDDKPIKALITSGPFNDGSGPIVTFIESGRQSAK